MCVKEKIHKLLSSVINTLGIVLVIWAVIVVIFAVHFRSLLVGVLGTIMIFSWLFMFLRIFDLINKILDSLKE